MRHKLIFSFLIFALFSAAPAAMAQPCAGTTVTPSSPSNTDVTCDSGATVLDITGSLGGSLGSGSSRNNNNTPAFSIDGTGAVEVHIAEGGDFGTVYGGIDAAGHNGNVTVHNAADSGGWSFSEDATAFGTGDDTINNAGLILATSGAQIPNAGARPLRQTTLSFGGGQDTFNNAGVLLIGDAQLSVVRSATSGTPLDNFFGKYSPAGNQIGKNASQAEFQDLETFNNSGLIVLGGFAYRGGTGSFTFADIPEGLGPRFYTSSARGEDYCGLMFSGLGLLNPPADGFLCTESPRIGDTDRLTNDVLYMPGTLFTGSGASTIRMDAEFGNGVAQTNCQDREPGGTNGEVEFFRLPGADCVDLRDGETAGSTQIVVRDAMPGDQGANNPDGIVIVDVSGGTSAAEHFTLSPASDYYLPLDNGRGSIQKGLFAFTLVYDESTQQHKLIGIPGAGALQMPLLAQAAQDLSRRATTSGLDERGNGVRNALRADAEVSGGFWGTISHDSAERDVRQSLTATGEEFVFNNDFDQDSTALTLGRDFVIGAGDGSAWLVGGSVGYLRGDLSFDATTNEAVLEGVAVGLYGGYQTGAWFLDAAFNQAFLQVDHFAPSYNLSGDDDRVTTKAQTQGLHLEGGYRLSLTDSLHVEPLASLSWVKADFDDLTVASPDNPLATSNTVEFGDATSLRGGLGARLSLDTRVAGLNLRYALTGRVWNETDGETDVTIKSTGPDATASNTFDGTFTEVQAGIALSNADDSLSGFLNADGTFQSDYESLGFDVGFRYQW